MTGKVTASREAVVTLEIHGHDGRSARVECVLDTGFTEHLTLPVSLIASLGLPYLATVRMLMADGRPVHSNVFGVVAVWDGAERAITVQDSTEPLIGMAMLHGCRVTMDVVDGGILSIEPLAEAG